MNVKFTEKGSSVSVEGNGVKCGRLAVAFDKIVNNLSHEEDIIFKRDVKGGVIKYVMRSVFATGSYLPI